MALSMQDKRNLSRFVRDVLFAVSNSLSQEFENHEYSRQIVDKNNAFMEDWKQVCSQWGMDSSVIYAASIYYKDFPEQHYSVYGPGGGRFYLPSCGLTSEQIEEIRKIKKQATSISDIRSHFAKLYRNYTDLVLDMPFVDSLSACGKLPVKASEVRKDNEPLIPTEELRNVIQTQIFKMTLNGEPLPRITRLKPFTYDYNG